MINHVNGLSFNSLIIHPVLSWGVAIVILIGLWNCSELLRRNFYSLENKKFAGLSLFFLVLVATSQIVFTLATLDLSSIRNLRLLGILLSILGFLKIIQSFHRGIFTSIFQEFKKDVLTHSLLFLFFLLCITPVSDADSIAYHLAVPLQILRNQTNHAIGEFWLHGRLIGSGEYLNMLGLAMGSDCFGSLTQWFTLFLFVRLVKSFILSNRSPVPLWTLMTAPVLLFIVYTQKHQLSGDLALISITLAFCVFGFEQSFKRIFLLLLPLFYAMSLKYSFYINGAALWLMLIIYMINNRQWRGIFNTTIISLLLYILILLPIHVFNYMNYGSPVSPFLQANQRPLLDFQQMLKNYQDVGFGFPLGILVPNSFSAITTILGFSPLAFIFGDVKNIKRKVMLGIGLILFIITMLLSQKSSRFFLTPIFIMNLSLMYCEKNYGEKIKRFVFWIQWVVVAGSIAVTLFIALPGAFTQTGRERAMRKLSYGFSVSQWIDGLNLPKNAILKTSMRSNLFWNKDFIAPEIKYFPKSNTSNQSGVLQITFEKSDRNQYLELIGQGNIEIASRNPFNIRKSNIYLYSIGPTSAIPASAGAPVHCSGTDTNGSGGPASDFLPASSDNKWSR